MLLVNINAHAQASAESLTAELLRVDFHLSHLYPICFPICSRFREASTLQRTEQNFVLASSRLPQYYRLASLGNNNNKYLACCVLCIYDCCSSRYLAKILKLLVYAWSKTRNVKISVDFKWKKSWDLLQQLFSQHIQSHEIINFGFQKFISYVPQVENRQWRFNSNN